MWELTRWDCDDIKIRVDIWLALLTCSSWHGPPRGWGLHTGSEPCYKNLLAQRIPSLHLTIKWKNNLVKILYIGTACTEILLRYASDFTRPLVQCVCQKDKDNSKGDQSCPPSQQEHNDHTTNSSQQRQPFIIQFKRWTPTWWQTHISTCLHTLKTLNLIDLCPLTWRVDNWSMKAAEVD